MRIATYLARLAVLLAITVAAGAPATLHADERGAIVHKTSLHGRYVEYVPRPDPKGILVIAHGSTEPGENVGKLAETFLRRWTRFADEHRLIAVAPVFDSNFGSWDREPGIALGGYRGLAGKQIGADEFVHGILEQYRSGIAGDGRFYLYGHSAGGQFVGRYAVRHPERVNAAVLSAAGRYAFPDPAAPWPYGQKEVVLPASSDEAPRTIRPDPEGWRKAAVLPITVVVGTFDTEPRAARPGHVGTTRVELAEQWVQAMTKLAPPGGGRLKLVTVPGVGHNSARLTPACQDALAAALRGH
jgi:pimeloyl-ACP methyl ester carboxylesterase